MSSFYNQNFTAEHSFKSQFNICNPDSCKLIWAWREKQLPDKTGVFISALKCGIWSQKKSQSLLKIYSFLFLACNDDSNSWFKDSEDKSTLFYICIDNNIISVLVHISIQHSHSKCHNL